MKFSRKIIIFGLALLFFSGIVLFGALTQERKQILQTLQQETEKPVFPKYSKANLPITVKDDLEVKTPENLFLITINLKEITKDESINIAKGLGFSKDLTEIESAIGGNIYGWNDTNNYLWITPKKSYLNFAMNQFPKITTDKKLSDQDFKNLALDFMADKFNLNKEIVEVSTISYYKLSSKSEGFDETTRNEAKLFHVNLTYKDVGYPILTSIPNFQILFVEILPNGEVYKAGAYILEKVNKSQENNKVKTYDEIKTSLNEAHLISLENVYIYLMDVQPDKIENINIQKIQIGYYFDDINLNTTLQPIYLLEGEIKIQDSTANYAKLYMPALKQ